MRGSQASQNSDGGINEEDEEQAKKGSIMVFEDQQNSIEPGDEEEWEEEEYEEEIEEAEDDINDLWNTDRSLRDLMRLSEIDKVEEDKQPQEEEGK